MFKKLLIISTAIIGILSGLYISLAHQSYGQTLPGVSFWHATSTPYVITPTYPSVQFSSSTQPLNPLNGESYYDTGLNLFQFYQNGLWTGLGSGSGGGSASASPPSLSVQYNNGSGILQGSSNLLFLNSATILALNGRLNASTSVITTATITNLTLLNPLTVSNGGTGTNTLASLTSNSSPNLTVTGGQNVLIGTSTQISLGSSVVTSLATGTSGTIFNGSIGANTLTLNLPFASALNTGQLLSTDWSTFNSKQAALTAGANISLSGTTISSNTFTQTVCPSGSSVSCNQTGNGTSDQTAINSAITAATPNGTVLLKSGTYTLSGAINMASGVTLMCDGDGTTINTTTTTSQSIYFNGVTNSSLVGCHVHDITPDSVGFGITSYRMIEVHNSHNIKIERNTLDNSSGYDIYNTSDSANSTTDVTILNNYIQNNGHQDAIGGGPFVQGNSTTSDITVIGNHIYNKVGNGTIGLNVDPNCFDMVNIIGLVFNGNECHGMVNLSTEKVPDQNIIISNNTLFPNSGATSTSDDIAIIQKTGGIATATPGQILVTGNTLAGGGIKFEGSPTSSIDTLIVSNNTIKNATTTAQGVDAIPASDGLYLDYVKNAVINGNTIVGNSSTTLVGIGIKLTTNNSNIVSSNNIIKDYTTGFDMGSVSSNKTVLDSYINDTSNTTNNGSLLNFNASGQLGIGTTGQAYPLQVVGLNAGATIQQLKLQNTGTSNNTGVAIDFNDSSSDLGTNPTAQIVGVRTGSPGGQLNFSTLNTAGSTGVRMFIDNLGNVNIATLTASSLVMTDGNKNLQSVTLGTNLSFSGTTLNASGSGGSGTISTSTNAIIGHEADWTGLATLGNGAWLDNGTVVGFNATSSTIGVNIQGSGGTNNILNVASSSGASDLIITSAGNIGIGTTSPDSLLTVRGSFPSEHIYNTAGSQFAGAGLYLINQVSSMGNQAGTAFYSGINDAGISQGYFAIDQTNTSGGGTGHQILLDYNAGTAEIYPKLLVNGNNAQLTQDSSGYLNFQEVAGGGNGQQSIFQILAPSSCPEESTLTLNRLSTSTPTNREFDDLSDEAYNGCNLSTGVDHDFSINISKQGSGTFRPGLIRFWNQDNGPISSTTSSTTFVGLSIIPNTNNGTTTPTNASSTFNGSLTVVGQPILPTAPVFIVASSTGQPMLTVSGNNNILFQNEVSPTLLSQKFFTVVGSQAGGIARFMRDTGLNPASNTFGTQDIMAYTSSTTVPNLFGPTQTFSVGNATGTNIIGAMGTETDSASTTGTFLMEPSTNGVLNISETISGNPLNPTVGINGTPGAINVLNIASSTGALLMQVNSLPTAATVYIQGTAGGTTNVLAVASSSTTNLLVVTTKGNVGIGSSTPNDLLDIQGSSGQTDNILFNVASSSTASLFSVGINTNGAQLQVSTTTETSAMVFFQGNASNPTLNVLTVASSSGATYLTIDQYGHKITGGTSPTCGTGCSSVTGDDSTFRAVTGSGVTAVTVNFSHAYSFTPVCISADESGGTTVSDASSTPTSVTMNLSASLTTKSLAVICQISANFTQ